MTTKRLDQELDVSRYIIVYKFILGLFELILGLGIIFVGSQMVEIYENFKAKELLEDPHDLLIGILEKIIPYLLRHQGYIVLILVVLGLVKIIGAAGLLYRKHWGLDLLVVLTISLLPFQVYNLIAFYSLAKLAYFAINVFIALYLVRFQPETYFSNLKRRMRVQK